MRACVCLWVSVLSNLQCEYVYVCESVCARVCARFHSVYTSNASANVCVFTNVFVCVRVCAWCVRVPTHLWLRPVRVPTLLCQHNENWGESTQLVYCVNMETSICVENSKQTPHKSIFGSASLYRRPKFQSKLKKLWKLFPVTCRTTLQIKKTRTVGTPCCGFGGGLRRGRSTCSPPPPRRNFARLDVRFLVSQIFP